MSFARINAFEAISVAAADELTAEYAANAPGEFPGASQMIAIRTGPTTGLGVTIYATA